MYPLNTKAQIASAKITEAKILDLIDTLEGPDLLALARSGRYLDTTAVLVEDLLDQIEHKIDRLLTVVQNA